MTKLDKSANIHPVSSNALLCIADYFHDLRHDENHHLGLGDIRLTIAQQEKIVDICNRQKSPVDCDVMQDLLIWLHAHEDDIANDINDYGDLKELFCQLYNREAGEIIRDDATW